MNPKSDCEIFIFFTGNLPPPIGGVTKFIYYLEEALVKSGVHCKRITIRRLVSSFFSLKKRVLLINSSNDFKRVLYTIVGKLTFMKVVNIKHGSFYSQEPGLLFRVAAYFSSLILTLNKETLKTLEHRSIKSELISTIFKENVYSIKNSEVKSYNLSHHNKLSSAKKRILFYANNNKTIKERSIYGVDFIYENLEVITSNYDLLFVDIQGQYKSLFKHLKSVIYFEGPQDFIGLLRWSDIYLRPTITDGNSVALLEALALGTPCVASDCITRPAGVTTFKTGSISSMLQSIEKASLQKESIVLDSFDSINRFIELVRSA